MSQLTPICFTIKILLAFSPKTREKPAKGKPNPEKPGAKKKVLPEITDPPYLIRLEKTCCYAHIEYEILPGKCKLYQIDVLCWKNAAKIYTSDSVKLFKAVSRNGWTFVPICIEHYLRELSINDLIALRNAVIEFNVYADKNKLGNAAKANKTELIYIKETDVDRTDFVDGFPEKVNLSSMTKKSMQTKSDNADSDTLSPSMASHKMDSYSLMRFPEKFADKFYEIIDYISDTSIPRDQITFRDFIKACDPPSVPKTMAPRTSDPTKLQALEKRSKKEEKSAKSKTTGKLTLQMQGEIFFTDVTNSIFQLEDNKSEVGKLFVIPHVDNLLTRMQKIQLNPIIIKIKDIQNFPEELFENTGFTDVYCTYSIPCIAECKTIEKPIWRTIKFMESHIFPTQNLPKIKLLEFLETRRFFVEVYGVQKDKDSVAEPKMFGEKPGDANISKLHVGFRKNCLDEAESSKTTNVLLAYCTYDLSSLLRNVWDFRAKEQLHTAESRIIEGPMWEPKDNPGENDHSCDFSAHFGLTVNQVNLAGISLKTAKTSALKDWMLMQNNTVLDAEAYLLSPQSASLVLHQIPNTYKRLFVIAFSKGVARHCLGNILRHNQRIICEDLQSDDILTGFAIDNGNNFAIYVEGRSIGYILNICQDCDNILPQEAKVFFNTDQAYERRLYAICSKWSGFYVINMKIPLEYIFKNQKVYVKGNVPILCQKAIIKLSLMFLSDTMKAMFQHDLFPTIEELKSLDIEFGVPYSWKSVAGSLSSVGTDEASIKQVQEA